MIAILSLVLGLALGVLGAWLLLRNRSTSLAIEIDQVTLERERLAEELVAKREENARLVAALEHERSTGEEKLELVRQTEEQLSEAFKALSAESLRANNAAFLQLARTALERFQVEARSDLDQRRQAVEELVRPISQSLQKVDTQIQDLERARSQAYGALTEQVRSLANSQEKLRSETQNLVTALRSPAVRGRWGEIQLRRVVEMAGMLSHCDFVEQSTAVDDDERRLRPDLIVRLPGGKNVVVDAKAPLKAYLEALEAPDEVVRLEKLQEHARQIRQHVAKLSLKGYWEQFQPTPEFVVLFIPGESFYSAALEHDPTLIEESVDSRVLIATPTTLIAVLKAVAYGWQQETVAESARAVSTLGRELYGRLAVLGEHFATLGKRLDGAVTAYNQTVGSLERRVLPAARRFDDLGAAAPKDIPELGPIDKLTQRPQAPELVEGQADEHNSIPSLPPERDGQGSSALDDAA